jgi:LytS/YehU family sensor histidine kinase
MVFQKRALALSQTVTVQFCYLVFIAANYYFNIYFIVPNYLYKNKYYSFIFLFLIGVSVTALMRVPLAMFLNKHYFLVSQAQPGFETIFIASYLNIFIWTLVIVSGKLIIDRFQFQLYIDKVNKQKEQAELDFLNAQMNPHFLFNSLNSIYGNIDKQNVSARNMLLTFSDMLRYQLYDCNHKSISIEKEITYLKNYMALQKERKEDDLSVAFLVDDNVKNILIAPLLFIAFVENAFKYVGANSHRENKVSISFHKKENEVLFQCYNTKGTNVLNSIEHKGIGLANAKRRLALLYPRQHSLQINDNEHFYEINIRLQII